MESGPRPEHRWLQQLVGSWECRGEGAGPPGEPPWTFEADETVLALGDCWIVGEGRGLMPDGSPALTQLTLGYDPARERFVGCFVGSMMTNLWVYEGSLDEARRVLTLRTEGPDMSTGRTAAFEDIHELVDDDNRVLRSVMQRADGSWTEVMRAHYRRKPER